MQFFLDRDEEYNDQSVLKQAETLKMRLTTIVTRTLICTNNSLTWIFMHDKTILQIIINILSFEKDLLCLGKDDKIVKSVECC